MVTVSRTLRIVRRVLGIPGRVWERRNSRWGDYIERAALAVALGFIVVAFLQIQSSRRDTIFRACVESNERHDSTVAELDRVLLVRVSGQSVDASTPPPVVEQRLLRVIASLPRDRRSEIEQSRASTRLLIDALSPKRDCSKRADRLTQ